MRPVSAVHYLFGDTNVTAYAGPKLGTAPIPGRDWLGYLRTMPHQANGVMAGGNGGRAGVAGRWVGSRLPCTPFPSHPLPTPSHPASSGLPFGHRLLLCRLHGAPRAGSGGR